MVNRIEKKRRAEPTPKDFEEIKRFLTAMAKMLVGQPESVVVKDVRNDSLIAFQVECPAEDVRFLIGARGKNADAMRTLLIAAGATRGITVQANFAELKK